jgi:hypothetical protein
MSPDETEVSIEIEGTTYFIPDEELEEILLTAIAEFDKGTK